MLRKSPMPLAIARMPARIATTCATAADPTHESTWRSPAMLAGPLPMSGTLYQSQFSGITAIPVPLNAYRVRPSGEPAVVACGRRTWPASPDSAGAATRHEYPTSASSPRPRPARLEQRRLMSHVLGWNVRPCAYDERMAGGMEFDDIARLRANSR